MNVCETCGRQYDYKKSSGHTKKRCNSCNSNRKRDAHRARAIEYLGGKCARCGYDRCKRALSFHHIEGKDFAISGNETRSWKSIVTEITKCALLCANCHMELHEGLWSFEREQDGNASV
jgi:hypothetical protein